MHWFDPFYFLISSQQVIFMFCRPEASIGDKSNSHPEGEHTGTPQNCLTSYYYANCLELCKFSVYIRTSTSSALSLVLSYRCIGSYLFNISTLWVCSCMLTSNANCCSGCYHDITNVTCYCYAQSLCEFTFCV